MMRFSNLERSWDEKNTVNREVSFPCCWHMRYQPYSEMHYEMFLRKTALGVVKHAGKRRCKANIEDIDIKLMAGEIFSYRCTYLKVPSMLLHEDIFGGRSYVVNFVARGKAT